MNMMLHARIDNQMLYWFKKLNFIRTIDNAKKSLCTFGVDEKNNVYFYYIMLHAWILIMVSARSVARSAGWRKNLQNSLCR